MRIAQTEISVSAESELKIRIKALGTNHTAGPKDKGKNHAADQQKLKSFFHPVGSASAEVIADNRLCTLGKPH